MKNSINYFSNRGVFLVFCCAFIVGDIIWIGPVSFLYWVTLSPLLWLLAGKRWKNVCIFSCIWLCIWVMIWNIGNLSHMQAYDSISRLTHEFEWKNTVAWTVGEKIYRKPQSQIYRLNVAKIDNISPEKESFFRVDPTIFIEVPLNMKINEGDEIVFTGKILKNIHFPLDGYDRFSYLQWGYGTIYLPLFDKISTAPIRITERIKKLLVSRLSIIFSWLHSRNPPGNDCGRSGSSFRRHKKYLYPKRNIPHSGGKLIQYSISYYFCLIFPKISSNKKTWKNNDSMKYRSVLWISCMTRCFCYTSNNYGGFIISYNRILRTRFWKGISWPCKHNTRLY